MGDQITKSVFINWHVYKLNKIIFNKRYYFKIKMTENPVLQEIVWNKQDSIDEIYRIKDQRMYKKERP